MKEELKLFKALSNETRLRILVLLSQKELCVCQLEWALKQSQAKISRHLTILKNAQLVKDRHLGAWIFYSLSKPKNNLERTTQKFLKEYFVKKYDLFKKDFENMKKCLKAPYYKLKSIKKISGGKND